VRDIHLENFSISNGGAELIENGNCTFAFGRRWDELGQGCVRLLTLCMELRRRDGTCCSMGMKL
jgi:hypothetical protein